jgi:hypothetical protein
MRTPRAAEKLWSIEWGPGGLVDHLAAEGERGIEDEY